MWGCGGGPRPHQFRSYPLSDSTSHEVSNPSWHGRPKCGFRNLETNRVKPLDMLCQNWLRYLEVSAASAYRLAYSTLPRFCL